MYRQNYLVKEQLIPTITYTQRSTPVKKIFISSRLSPASSSNSPQQRLQSFSKSPHTRQNLVDPRSKIQNNPPPSQQLPFKINLSSNNSKSPQPTPQLVKLQQRQFSTPSTYQTSFQTISPSSNIREKVYQQNSFTTLRAKWAVSQVIPSDQKSEYLTPPKTQDQSNENSSNNNKPPTPQFQNNSTPNCQKVEPELQPHEMDKFSTQLKNVSLQTKPKKKKDFQNLSDESDFVELDSVRKDTIVVDSPQKIDRPVQIKGLKKSIGIQAFESHDNNPLIDIVNKLKNLKTFNRIGAINIKTSMSQASLINPLFATQDTPTQDTPTQDTTTDFLRPSFKDYQSNENKNPFMSKDSSFDLDNSKISSGLNRYRSHTSLIQKHNRQISFLQYKQQQERLNKI